jgi:Protein of unknown function (DUF3108)
VRARATVKVTADSTPTLSPPSSKGAGGGRGTTARSAEWVVGYSSALLAAVWVFWASGALAATVEPNRIFRNEERLVYDVTWLGIKAGQATMEVRGAAQVNGQPAVHLVTTARSSPLISKIYPVDDRSESYLGLDPMRALRFEKHLREGRYRHDSRTDFDHQGGVATFRYLDFSPVPKGISSLDEAEKFGKYVTQELPLTSGSLDELSLLYYVRGLPLAVGATVKAKVFASKKNWDLEVRVLGRESLDTVLGRRETLIVEPLLKFEGVFQQKGRVIVWLTDDLERIPVLMKSQIKVGSFVSTLTRRETEADRASLTHPEKADQ